MKKEIDIENRTYAFSLKIIKLAKRLNSNRENDILIRQLVRSATSVGANVHEARVGHSKKDFINFHSIALKSANETIYWLKLLRDTNQSGKDKVNVLIDEVEQLAKIIATIKINASH